jgi:phosphatidylglycerol:prolipoprotein diacylglycerol transferase
MRPLLSVIAYDPIVRFRVGPLSLSPHGLGIAVGFLVGIYGFFLPGMRKEGIEEEQAYGVIMRVLVGSLVGTRLFYVINHLDQFPSPLDYFKVWQGGLTLLGGITGAVSLSYLYCRRRNIPFFKISDPAMPGLAAGLIFGRIGDLVIADHLGKPTSFFLGYRCPIPAVVGETVGSPCPPGITVHQTALYDLFVAIALLVVLLVLRRKETYLGFLTLVFGAVYGLARFIEDFLRADKTIAGLTGSQWVALAVSLYCIYVLTIRRTSPRWGTAGSEAEAEEEEEDSPDDNPQGDSEDSSEDNSQDDSQDSSQDDSQEGELASQDQPLSD